MKKNLLSKFKIELFEVTCPSCDTTFRIPLKPESSQTGKTEIVIDCENAECKEKITVEIPKQFSPSGTLFRQDS
jgi:hypothetical protein